MIKFIITLSAYLMLTSICNANINIVIPGPPPAEEEEKVKEEPKQPPASSPKSPSNTVGGISKIISNIGGGVGKNVGGGGFNNAPDGSGDFGLTNLSLSGGVTLTSFDDTTVGSSGHFREYSLSLSGDLTESDRINIGVSNSRFETGGVNSLLARTYGISFAWIHSLNENYGAGAFGLLNSIDIEETNGNTYSYGYGLLFTTSHDLGSSLSLSSVTALAHTDFDTGYDQLLMTSWTLSKAWTDKFSSYLTLGFTDSLKSDPDGDPTYGSWEVGGTYYVNDNLSLGLGFQRTEFLNNYSDNTLLFNVGWLF